MPDDFDHEVIDSPQALLRHLYEAHGVEEALDLDPATAPLQFWLRRHAELERGSRAPGEARPAPQQAPQPRRDPPGRESPAPSGPRYRPFADPLVEAVTAALARRGLEERQVRRWIASYSSPDGRGGGEDGVRASFLDPILDALAAHVSGAGAPDLDADFMAIADALQSRRPRGGRGRREAAATPPPRRPADDRDDYMALADAVQQRRGATRR